MRDSLFISLVNPAENNNMLHGHDDASDCDTGLSRINVVSSAEPSRQ
jgi:hypothetical protein